MKPTALILSISLALALATPACRQAPRGAMMRSVGFLPPREVVAGDPSMFHLDAFAGVAGVTVDAPIICDTVTGEAMIVVHGRGRRRLSQQARPACRTPDATLEDCPMMEADAFYKALRAVAHTPFGGIDCGDAPRVGGPILEWGWESADWAVRVLVELMTAWDVRVDLAALVMRPIGSPSSHP